MTQKLLEREMTKKEELKGMKESRSRELRCVRRECFGEKKVIVNRDDKKTFKIPF